MFGHEDIEAEISRVVRASPFNYVSEDEAIDPSLAGMQIFDDPLVGVASAHDPLFVEMRKLEAVGPQFTLPEEWLEGATSVVSFFLPFTERVRAGNAADPQYPSPEWLHARIEGQRFIGELDAALVGFFGSKGFNAVAPSFDERFFAVKTSEAAREHNVPKVFTSNWSERHVAYIAGLGTFGLSKGLITERGIAGRFGSIVTDAPLNPTSRPYSGLYDYCIMCGACARRCPVSAISIEAGKEHQPCSDYLQEMGKRFAPRYGCGKCQVRVPCEHRIPKRQA